MSVIDLAAPMEDIPREPNAGEYQSWRKTSADGCFLCFEPLPRIVVHWFGHFHL